MRQFEVKVSDPALEDADKVYDYSINYKKLAILYSINDDTVIIERVIPQKMVV